MQIFLPPEVEAMVQRQVATGKYTNVLEVILAGVKLLEEQEDIYQGRLEELQKEARIGCEASKQGKVVDGSTAMAQIRAKLRSSYAPSRRMTPKFHLTEPAIKDIQQIVNYIAVYLK